MRKLNEILLQIAKRAETHDPKYLVDSFVNLGSVFTLLKGLDNQIVFGRRGTGKTHLLNYLDKHIAESDRVSIQIDMRTMGSTGGIYAANDIPLSERGTRLLVDTLCCIYERILGIVLEKSDLLDLSAIGPFLDAFAESSTSVVIQGKIELSTSDNIQHTDSRSSGISGELSSKGATIKVSSSEDSKLGTVHESRIKREGKELHRVIFGSVQRDLQRIIDHLPSKQLWILLDEWSEIPMDLQPYLADLIRRTVMPCRGAVVKIAAIEQRTQFRVSDGNAGYIGMELGADASASINLDEFMVFENNGDKAKEFFCELLFRHAKSIHENESTAPFYRNANEFVSEVFTQVNVADEFVKASEGVPRDAINIIGIAAQSNINDKFSMQEIRKAARTWYTRNKASSVNMRQEAQELLNWIIDSVIKHRKARAFLMQSDLKDPLIDYLYDSRLLHIIKTGVSSNDAPGRRYSVYAIDYGCYVDLINTANAPIGLFEIDNQDSEPEYTEVPQTDYRSIRRAILNIDAFYSRNDTPTQFSLI